MLPDKTLFRIPDTKVTYYHLMYFAALVLMLVGALMVWSYYLDKPIKPPPSAQAAMAAGILPEELIKSQDINSVLDAIYNAAHQETLAADSPFTKVADDMSTALLGMLVSRLSLSEEEAQQVLTEYYQSRSAMISQIHEVMQSRQENLGQPVHSEISHPYYDSVNDFVESISGHACMFVSFPMAARAKQLLKVAGKGSSMGKLADKTSGEGSISQAFEVCLSR